MKITEIQTTENCGLFLSKLSPAGQVAAPEGRWLAQCDQC